MLRSETRRCGSNGSYAQLGATTYAYDKYDRLYTSTDARNGTTTLLYNNLDLVTSSTAPSSGTGGSRQVTTTTYDKLGRVSSVTQPDGSVVTNCYYANGQLWLTQGGHNYPVAYGYDDQGRMRYMTNWQTYGSSSALAVTRWNYSATRGWLISKDYPDKASGSVSSITEGSGGPVYDYTPAGRLWKRTWLRATSTNSSTHVVTTYTYNGAGDLVGVAYNDGTPGVSNSYDRFGRRASVTQSTNQTVASATFSYDNAGLLLGESHTAGPLSGLSVSVGYFNSMQRSNLTASGGYSVSYGYDTAGRLEAVIDKQPSASNSEGRPGVKKEDQGSRLHVSHFSW